MSDVRVTVFDDAGDELAAWRTTSEGEHVVDEPQVIDAAYLQRQCEFSERTFGPPRGNGAGVIDHIRKELIEIEQNPDDLEEWIDVTMLALDGAWRAGHKPQQIIDALIAKLDKNEKRKWPDWRTADPNKAIEHDRSYD